jgi:predicted Rossmann fold nucleotide-binding protein DprA/Smf involved in DNA uptake
MIDLKARNREALKALREQRGPETEAAQARLKEQTTIVKEITRVLKEGPRTVPALAEATGLPTQTVFWHLIALKKYGKVVEGDQEGDYFQYGLTGDGC